MTEGIKEELVDRYEAAKVFHDLAAEYDSWFGDSLVYRIELAALQSLQIEMQEPKLEIGVGPGHFARDLGVSFGIDPATGPLQLALQRGIKCCRGFGEELPLGKGTVGTIYLLFTLCFGAAPRKIIRESCETLKKGGFLVIGMIPARGTWGKYLVSKKKAGHVFYRHANFYTIETVRNWLTEARMSIVEARSTLYQPPERVEHQEEPRKGLDEDAGFAVIAARKNYV